MRKGTHLHYTNMKRNMVRAIIEQIDDPDNADLKRKINTAYKAHKKSPDVMALVATYYWNESLVRFIFAEDDWNKTRRIAKKLCAKAVKLDKTVVKRWPFVGAVVGKPKGRKESPFGNNQRKAKRPERSATTKSKLKPPPGRPAVFQFGISPEEAKAACVLEGHRFKETSVASPLYGWENG